PDDPLALARDYVSKGMMELAVAEATRAVQRGADAGQAATLLGDIYARRGLHGEALERYREARTLDAANSIAALGEVKSLLAVHRAAEALPLAEALVAKAPEDVEILVATAKARSATGDAAGARAAVVRLAEMLEQDPYDMDALMLLGRALLDDKRDAEALEAFRRALKFDPQHTGALFYLGATLARLQRYGEAVDAWERVTRIDP